MSAIVRSLAFVCGGGAARPPSITHDLEPLPLLLLLLPCWPGVHAECNGHGIYAQFMTLVTAEDPSRPPWPSCPSNGWVAGVDRLWSLANGSPSGMLPKASAPEYRDSTIMPERAGMVVENVPCGVDGATGAPLNCTLLYNVDLAEGTLGPSPNASNPQDCCQICSTTSGCWAAVYNSGQCWIKTAGQNNTVWAQGRVAVFPPGSGPIPPMPPTPGA